MRRAKAYTRVERRLTHQVGKAIARWNLIDDGDRILVAVSGGKDSWSLLGLLDLLRRRAPVHFELVAWHLDQGQPGHSTAPLAAWLEEWGGEHVIARVNTWAVVREHVPEGATACSLCSRLRRGVMYNAAVELGCNKIALGHHADDSIETLLLNLFFSGQTKAMPALLRSDDGRNVVIRPLILCWEEQLASYAAQRAFPVLSCAGCSQQPDLQRQEMKALLRRLEADHPQLRRSMLAALGNVRPTHLLDQTLGT